MHNYELEKKKLLDKIKALGDMYPHMKGAKVSIVLRDERTKEKETLAVVMR